MGFLSKELQPSVLDSGRTAPDHSTDHLTKDCSQNAANKHVPFVIVTKMNKERISFHARTPGGVQLVANEFVHYQG